jgi:hypothetical protein
VELISSGRTATAWRVHRDESPQRKTRSGVSTDGGFSSSCRAMLYVAAPALLAAPLRLAPQFQQSPALPVPLAVDGLIRSGVVGRAEHRPICVQGRAEGMAWDMGGGNGVASRPGGCSSSAVNCFTRRSMSRERRCARLAYSDLTTRPRATRVDGSPRSRVVRVPLLKKRQYALGTFCGPQCKRSLVCRIRKLDEPIVNSQQLFHRLHGCLTLCGGFIGPCQGYLSSRPCVRRFPVSSSADLTGALAFV